MQTIDNRTFEVEGELLSLRKEDLSKTSRRQLWKTTLEIKVLSSKNLQDEAIPFPVKQFEVQRDTQNGDEDLKPGDKLYFQVAVDKLDGPRYFYWVR